MNEYIWLFIGGVVIFIGGILLKNREKKLFENAIPATATVILYDQYRDPGHSHTMYTAVVSYSLTDGTIMEAKEQCGRSRMKYEIGQTLDIEYSPQKPDFFVVRGDGSRSFAFAIMLFFGLAMVAISIILYLQQAGIM